MEGTFRFCVDSSSCDPHCCGPIEIELGPDKIGLRWMGQTEFSYFEWWAILLFMEGKPNPTLQKYLKELLELAWEKGFNAGLKHQISEAKVLRTDGKIQFAKDVK